MGSGFSRAIFPCINNSQNHHEDPPDLIFAASEALDETLGHSFCYVRSSARFLSPTPSGRLSPSQSLRLSPSHEPHQHLKTRPVFAETGFRSISGASVSANTYTPRTVLQHDHIYDDATDSLTATANANNNSNKNSSLIFSAFESTSSFSALPLQPVPRGDAAVGSGPGIDRGGFFMSGPIERGALSGPLDANAGGGMDAGQVHFSAPLNGIYVKRRRKKGLSGIRKAFYRNLSEKKRPWVVPVLNFGRKDGPGSGPGPGQNPGSNHGHGGEEGRGDSNVQWAHGKAGEDRVHVVVSEEQGWLFVGIYDGFNGPDAPEFLMSNLYRAVFNELKGLFWEVEEATLENLADDGQEAGERIQENVELVEEIDAVVKNCSEGGENGGGQVVEINECLNQSDLNCGSVKRVTFQEEEEQKKEVRRGKPLWEFLAEDDTDDGFDLSGSDRFAFSVDDALSLSNNAGSIVKRGSLLLSKLKYGFSKHKEGGQGHSRRFLPWRYNWEEKEKTEIENRAVEKSSFSCKRRRIGPVDPELVLRSLSRALEITELAYLEMTDRVLDLNPELALMGSCLLVVLMRDEDVYVMNVGDSRAIVAQYQPETGNSNEKNGRCGAEGIVEEPIALGEELKIPVVSETPAQTMRLAPLQLSTDHSTSIKEEVLRIKKEHPDDSQCIVNDRVKGRLKVTRAFGAGFLKQPKLNNALLEMFRNEYIGNAPYISCSPSLRHHKLGPDDQFLILSSDGLYQYLSNEEVVSHVENFMEKFPDGDPAQHLIEELLFRAAKKAGMDFHELLDIPQGDRRKYHDDVTVMVISLEGRIWKSSGKYL